MSIMPETNRVFSSRGLPAASGVEALRPARAPARNLVEVFRGRAALAPEQIAFTFLADDESPEAHVTYGGLDERARAIAAHLQQQCRPRDRVLLMYGPGLEYIAALAGCMYAGVVAVPVYPPDPLRVARTLPRLAGIVRDAQACAILGTATDLAWAGAMLGDLPGLESLIATDEIAAARQRDWREPELDRDSLAILQYTSGSTGEPKGVMIQHGNALQNLAQMEAAIDIEDAVVATWLPAYHDMGLFGGILQCWYSGRRNIMMSPLAFFQRPLRWLQAISDHRATTAGAPNFAYDLCVRKTTPDERRRLDLSCWRLALSGAEPVRPETMERFLAAFAECGVRPDIFKPCYGLAETTLMVASTPKNEPAQIRAFDADRLSAGEAVAANNDTPSTLRLASCGQGVCGQDLLIVDPQSLIELPAGRSGEIWVAGLHVAAGYWNRPDETARTFNARTSTGRGPFLRTGDVGFIHDGELFISGRLKEMIIVQGRNHYPADLEQTAEASHDAVRGCCGAAFSVEVRGRERVVLVHEVARPNRFDLAEVARLVRWEVLDAHDVVLDHLVLVRRGTIPKTTSGKIQRGACRERFLAHELDSLFCWKAIPAGRSAPAEHPYQAPRTPLEESLAETWAEVLGLERVGIHDHFLDLGGHSLLAAQLANRLGPRLGVEIPLRELLERPTIAALAELIERREAEQFDREQAFLSQLETMSDEEAQALLAKLARGESTADNQDTTTS